MNARSSQALALVSSIPRTVPFLPARRPALVLKDSNGCAVRIVSGSDMTRVLWESALDAAGVAIPLQNRVVWRHVDAQASLFGVVVDANGRPRLGFGAMIGLSRAYPGLEIVRVQRFGGNRCPEAVHAAVCGLTRWARLNGVLRLHIEVHSESAELREAIGEACADSGFRRCPMRSYARTVKLDLTPPPEVIFGSLHATARRHIRAVDKRPVEIREIEDPRLANRMNVLLKESLERTGGRFERYRFADLIRFASGHPHLARVVGLFRKDAEGPDALLAFAVGYHHGDHTEYGVAGCTRRTDVKMPLMYGLAWDLILWSRNRGARWFDFGGIASDDNAGHRAEGIGDFKRYFVREVIDVGEEWVFEPHPVRSAVARKVTSLARWLTSARRWSAATVRPAQPVTELELSA